MIEVVVFVLAAFIFEGFQNPTGDYEEPSVTQTE